MITKHTPAPWTVNYSNLRHGFEILKDYGDRSYELAYTVSDMVHEETEANARLIAAAPELLEALRTVFNCFDCQRDELCEASIAHVPELEAARAAIAKAEGRTE